jgi:uncharacterized protein YodC (DUF2158 family)
MERKMERKFKTGDLVQLKSGGATMTVESYASNEHYKVTSDPETVGKWVYCVWFMGDKTMRDTFHEHMLIRVERMPRYN